jgi:diguanylate cyclase (GGDEF)-like protein/PAS domain S-box-containing protein
MRAQRRETVGRETSGPVALEAPLDAPELDSDLVPSPAGWPEAVERLEVNEAVRESEARLQALLSSLDDLVFELDRDGNYLGVWTVRDDLLVRPRHQLLGHNVREFIGEELAAEVLRAIRRALRNGTAEMLDYSLDVPSGTRWFQARMAPIGDKARTVCFLARDITGTKLAEQARDDAEERLRHLAMHDGLTGLPNRMYFCERLEQALWKCRRRGQLAVLMLDLDRFKDVNDTLGHAAGDIVLQEVARRLSAVTRGDDVVARLGGDEFAILLSQADEEAAAAVALRVAACLADPIAVDPVLVDIDASTGIAVCPRDGRDADALLRRADVAMYAAKRRKGGFAPLDAATDVGDVPTEVQTLLE